MLAVFISMIRNCNDFKVNKSRQYNILGFDLNMPSDPKSFRDFRARVLQKIPFFLHDFDSSYGNKIIIWWSIWILVEILPILRR